MIAFWVFLRFVQCHNFWGIWVALSIFNICMTALDHKRLINAKATPFHNDVDGM